MRFGRQVEDWIWQRGPQVGPDVRTIGHSASAHQLVGGMPDESLFRSAFYLEVQPGHARIHQSIDFRWDM